MKITKRDLKSRLDILNNALELTPEIISMLENAISLDKIGSETVIRGISKLNSLIDIKNDFKNKMLIKYFKKDLKKIIEVQKNKNYDFISKNEQEILLDLNTRIKITKLNNISDRADLMYFRKTLIWFIEDEYAKLLKKTRDKPNIDINVLYQSTINGYTIDDTLYNLGFESDIQAEHVRLRKI